MYTAPCKSLYFSRVIFFFPYSPFISLAVEGHEKVIFSWSGVRETKEFDLGFVFMFVCINLLCVSMATDKNLFGVKKNTRLFPGNQHYETS